MFSTPHEIPTITQFIRRLRGGSEPVLVRASDGRLYVAKYRNNLQGPNVLFNESCGAELYRACGLLTPEWQPLHLTESFLDRNPDAWMQTDDGPRRPEPGRCIGFQYLRPAPGKTYGTLPCSAAHRVANRMSFWLAWLIDVCANHVDNRQAIFKEELDGLIVAYFIDHGHMFGGPDGRHRLPRCASHYIDPRMYPDLTRDDVQRILAFVRSIKLHRIWKQIDRVPDEWKTATTIDAFGQCLEMLSDPMELVTILEELVGWVERCTGRDLGLARSPKAPYPDGVRAGVDIGQFVRVQFAG